MHHIVSYFHICSIAFLYTMVVSVAKCDIIVIAEKSNITVDIFPSLPANFGEIIPDFGIKGYLVVANPLNACSPIDPPPNLANKTVKWIVLIKRYDCNFVDKVRSAQDAHFDAAIIYNVGSNLIEPMAGEDSDDINISAIFVGQDDGLRMQSLYRFDSGYQLLLTNELPFNINSYLLPFAIVIAICFIIMVIFMVVKCFRERRRMRRYRLPYSSLKSIPTSKFKKGDPYETCAICLEDYIDGDKLRVLPCAHAYHCKCVDPWLTRSRRVCPVCKRRVLAHNEQFSDSDSEHEDETRPLLRPAGIQTRGGTFDTTARRPQNADLPNAAVAVDDHQHSAATTSAVVVVDMDETNEHADESENEFSPSSDSRPIPSAQVSSELETPTGSEMGEPDTSLYFTPQRDGQTDNLLV